MACPGLADNHFNEQYFDMFIIFLAVNAIRLATVLIFGIFCPPGLVEIENGAGIFQDDRLDAFRGAVFKRGNDLGCSYE